MTSLERGELRTTLEHIERARLEVMRAAVCHAAELDDVQREFLTASAALARAERVLMSMRSANQLEAT